MTSSVTDSSIARACSTRGGSAFRGSCIVPQTLEVSGRPSVVTGAALQTQYVVF